MADRNITALERVTEHALLWLTVGGALLNFATFVVTGNVVSLIIGYFAAAVALRGAHLLRMLNE